MNPVIPPSSRRAVLAAAAALSLGAWSRPGNAQARPEEVLPMCCGGGPPDVVANGLGLQTQLASPVDANLTYRFTNQKTGGGKKGPWWVFAVGARIPEVNYFKISNPGTSLTVVFFDITTPVVARAYRVEFGFALDLIWLIGSTPIFFSRPFGTGE